MAPERVSADLRTAMTTMARTTTRTATIPRASPRITMSMALRPGSAADSDVVAGCEQLRLRSAQLVLGFRGIAATGLRRLIGRAGLGDIDLVGELRVLRED